MARLKEILVRQGTQDPHMWAVARKGVQWLLDGLFDDLQIEAKKAVKAAVLAEDDRTAAARGELATPCPLTPWGFRAFVLHHYIPHNRSIFGKLRDPAFLFLSLLTMIPVFGVREAIFAFLLL